MSFNKLNLEKVYTWSEEFNLWSKDDKAAIAYSDGDETENYIYQVINGAKDRSIFSDELRSSVKDWPSFYYFSPTRTNLLRPISNIFNGFGLEIGCGCGALSRYIGELGSSFIALEGSHRRAEITALRCCDLKNVQVVVDNAIDFSLKGFDWCTLIGVLEYSTKFIKSDNPVKSILSHLYSILNNDGVLVIAIENLLGLKYLAGAPEDHYGVPFWGINDLYPVDGTQTFTKSFLENVLKEVGFKKTSFLYPFPDYKQPRAIISGLASNYQDFNLASLLTNNCRGSFDYYDRTFSEDLLWKAAVENNSFEDLSNSFLIVAEKKSGIFNFPKDVLACCYSTARGEVGSVETRIIADDRSLKVTRTPVTGHLIETQLVRQNISDETYLNGELYIRSFYKILNKPNWTIDDLVTWAKPWKNFLVERSIEGKGECLPGRYLDCCPQNIIIDTDGGIRPFDLEWEYKKNISLGWLMTRGLFLSFMSIDAVAPSDFADLTIAQLIIEILKSLSIPCDFESFDSYSKLESEFYYHTLKNYGDVHKKMAFKLNIRHSIIEQKNLLLEEKVKVKNIELEMQKIKNESSETIAILNEEKENLKNIIYAVENWKQSFDQIRCGRIWRFFILLRRIKIMLLKNEFGGRIGFFKWLIGRREQVDSIDPFSDFPDCLTK